MQYLEIAIRCLVGTVFLASSVTKVVGRGAFENFVGSVRDMRLMRASGVRPVARCVVVVESAVWLLLAVPTRPTAAAGFLVAAGLLAVFDVGIWLAVRRGARTTCRCFGASSTRLGPQHLIRNLALIVIAALGAVATGWAAGPVRLAGIAVAVPAGLVVGGLFAVVDDVVGLFQPLEHGPGNRAYPSMTQVTQEETRDAFPGFGGRTGGGGVPAESGSDARHHQAAARAC
jgi:hypothetical protein